MDQIHQELRKTRRQNLIQTVITVFLILIVGLTFGIVKTNLPVLSSIGPQGKSGNSETVDYDKISSEIDKKIAALPKPQDGKDSTVPGPSGLNGANGSNASPCTILAVEGGAQITCPDGSTAFVSNGVNGEAGQPAKNREERCVQEGLYARKDYRYEGDINWTVDYYLPVGSTCP